MPKLPQYVYVQIDDVDDGELYLACQVDPKNLPFTPSPNHPVAKYRLEEATIVTTN